VTPASADALLWALVVLPAATGAALLLLPRRLDRAAPVAGVGAAALTALVALAVAGSRPAVAVPFVAGSDLGMRVDGLAAVVAPTVALVTAVVLLAGAADVREARARFHGLMLVFAAAALLTVTATTLPTLLLAWEVMGATSYALIGFRWSEQRRVGSGLTAFLTTRAADLGLYAAAGAALAGGAGLGLSALPSAASGWRDVVALGVLVAALGKAAQLVLAFWLSRAMDGPSPVSALLHSAAMVAMGGYLLLRLSPLLQATGWAGTAAAWAGAVTTVALGLVAVGQADLKQLLAASTSAQLGFVVTAAGLGATAAGTAHLVAHAATKAGLFLAAGAWLSALGTKQLAGLRGAVAEWPAVRVAASVGLLALAGVPPLSLWASKDLVLAAELEASVPLYVAGLVGAALSAAYAGRALAVLWAPVDAAERERAAAHRGEEEEPRGRVPRPVTVAVVVLATAAAALGVLAVPSVAEAVARTVGGPLVEPTPAELVGSAVLALVVVAAAWRIPWPEPKWALSWLGLERAAHVLVVGPVLGLARLLDRADAGLATGVDATARGTARLAAHAGTVDDRWVDGAVRGVARQARRAGALARRPQTGLLHQYYVQAVVLVASGAAVLVLVR
jgi:NADH:ubiquinone oxidoreductase subunit 5 (subunit L)/multisubunit Na+/H+ antiporter MnhA subunit